MTGTEFYNSVAQLEKFYQKELEQFEKDIWYKTLGKMKIERFNKIIEKAYIKCKFMPKLADIFEINKEIPYKELYEKKYKEEKCTKCNSVGIIFYTKLIDEKKYTYGARCDCSNANNFSLKIPSIQQIGL